MTYVKIQDLIGCVSEYMLMRPTVNRNRCDLKRPIKQLMYADFCYDMDENKIIACLCKFHSRADIIGAYAESEYI